MHVARCLLRRACSVTALLCVVVPGLNSGLLWVWAQSSTQHRTGYASPPAIEPRIADGQMKEWRMTLVSPDSRILPRIWSGADVNGRAEGRQTLQQLQPRAEQAVVRRAGHRGPHIVEASTVDARPPTQESRHMCRWPLA